MISETELQKILETAWGENNDPSHDLGHIRRVVASARAIAEEENADLDIIIPAAWLHDCVNLPKNHPERHLASKQAAEYAINALKPHNIAPEKLDGIYHAILAHSFSANIKPETLEAKIVQDADRLDSLGAIGIARTFAVSGQLERALFDPHDPLAQNRPADDFQYGLDHFFVKLFRIAETLHTASARRMAEDRVQFMRDFSNRIASENGL